MNTFEQLDILDLIEEYKKLTTLSKLIELKIEDLIKPKEGLKDRQLGLNENESFFIGGI